MRIIIETEEGTPIAMSPTIDPKRTEASDAGPPQAALFQSISAAGSSATTAGGLYGQATDAGEPSPLLAKVLGGAAPSAMSVSGADVVDGGAAPQA